MLFTRKGKLILVVVCVLIAAAVLLADRAPSFRTNEKAFYLDEKTLSFVRPGLRMSISKAEIAADGTIKAWVKFTDSQGQPLDRLGIQTPGAITASLLVATIPANETQYVSYITRQRTGGGRTVTQATGENTGTWAQVANGEYTYTFLNKAPSNIDRSATHSIGMYGSRNLTEFELSIYRADAIFNFVPSGAAVTKIRDVVRTSSCNKCHDQLAFHGGNRRTVEVCAMCHTPQTPEPITNNTTDLKVMVHKIHMGASLPSVVAKGKYMVANADYSTVVNPSPVMACTACHEPQSVSGARQADNWMTKPSRETCGSCHENVNFATGQGHVAGPASSDAQCSQCHLPKGELDFDASVAGAHAVPAYSSLLPGVRFTIEAVDNLLPGRNPIVTFTVKDKAGKPVLMSQMTTMRIYMAGPTTDIPSYIREDALRSEGPGDGRYFFTFAATIPADAKGSFQFGAEGYRNVKVYEGTTKERTIRDAGPNAVKAFAVGGGTAQPRRAVVSSEKCNKCHYNLSFHGGNRSTVESCTFCHNATLVVGTQRESFNFVNMIHRIHGEEARYPGVISNCSQCHINGTEVPPVSSALLKTVNGMAPITPTPPVTNACLSCHNEAQAWRHAAANTSDLGESCSVCHGAGREFGVSKVHAQ